jgi:hypothetical protein
VAGGFKSLFITLDGNYTTDPIVSSQKGQVGDKPIESFTFAPRFGILMSSGRFGAGAVWVGGMCLIATSEIHDRIDLSQRPFLAHPGRTRPRHRCFAEITLNARPRGAG